MVYYIECMVYERPDVSKPFPEFAISCNPEALMKSVESMVENTISEKYIGADAQVVCRILSSGTSSGSSSVIDSPGVLSGAMP